MSKAQGHQQQHGEPGELLRPLTLVRHKHPRTQLPQRCCGGPSHPRLASLRFRLPVCMCFDSQHRVPSAWVHTGAAAQAAFIACMRLWPLARGVGGCGGCARRRAGAEAAAPPEAQRLPRHHAYASAAPPRAPMAPILACAGRADKPRAAAARGFGGGNSRPQRGGVMLRIASAKCKPAQANNSSLRLETAVTNRKQS